MVIVVFEFEPMPEYVDRYFELAGALRSEVEQIDGFISVERFESVNQSGRFVSVSTGEISTPLKHGANSPNTGKRRTNRKTVACFATTAFA